MTSSGSAKRLLLLVLTAIALLACMAFAPHAYAATSGDFEYEVESDGTAVIVGYVGTGGDVVIPSDIDGYPVTSIGDSAFKKNEDVVSLCIPEGVVSIGEAAFQSCSSLGAVELPDSLRKISARAFCNCTLLRPVDLVIPDGVNHLGDLAFGYCSSLRSVYFPDALTYIHADAFSYCHNLKTIYCSTASGFETALFMNVTDNWIHGSADVEAEYRSPDGFEYVFFNSARDAVCIAGWFGAPARLASSVDGFPVKGILTEGLKGCASLKSAEFASGTKRIGEDAFYGCISLEHVALPSTLESIGSSAFSGCSNLIEIEIPISVTRIGNGAFANCDSIESLSVPEGVARIDDNAFGACDRLKRVSLPSTLSVLGEGILAGSSALEAVFLPSAMGFSPVVLTGYMSESTLLCVPDTEAKAYLVDYGVAEERIMISDLSANALSAADCVYTGSACRPEVYVSNSHAKMRLLEGVDYEAEYSSNVNSGTATAEIEGRGFFRGAGRVTFEIGRASLSNVSVSSVSAKTYTGKYIKPTPIVKANGRTLALNKDYTLSHKNNLKSGKATVTVKGKGNYTGSKSVYFKIKPAKVLYPKATSPAKAKVKASWSNARGKAANVTGYKVVVKSGTKAVKTVFVAGKASNAKTVAVPAKHKGKKLNVRVYAYKTIDGVKVLGPSSAVKYVTVRK